MSTKKNDLQNTKNSKIQIGNAETSYKNTYSNQLDLNTQNSSKNIEDFVYSTPVKSILRKQTDRSPPKECNKKTCYELRSYKGKHKINLQDRIELF